MAFLQIVTRTFGRRPTLLARNQSSLAALRDPDWEQTLVVDEIGRGVNWANTNLANVPASSEYVWVLDDDDMCALPSLLSTLKRLRAAQVIVMRTQHALFGVLPHNAHWGGRPVLGDCGWSNYFVRSDVWNAHRAVLANMACYEADHVFAAHLWDQGVGFVWHDAIAAIYPQASRGAAE